MERQKETEGKERKNAKKEVLTFNILQTETHYFPSSPPRIPSLRGTWMAQLTKSIPMTSLRSPGILGLLLVSTLLHMTHLTASWVRSGFHHLSSPPSSSVHCHCAAQASFIAGLDLKSCHFPHHIRPWSHLSSTPTLTKVIISRTIISFYSKGLLFMLFPFKCASLF